MFQLRKAYSNNSVQRVISVLNARKKLIKNVIIPREKKPNYFSIMNYKQEKSDAFFLSGICSHRQIKTQHGF